MVMRISLDQASNHNKTKIDPITAYFIDTMNIIMNILTKNCILLVFSYLLIHLCSATTLASAQDTRPSSANNNIQEAIEICREKLKVDPYFPKVQHSLAQLLDSRIAYDEPVDEAMVEEVVEWYHAVGQPPPDVLASRIPPAHIRFDSLVRAGTIAEEILHSVPKAIEMYILALKLDGIDDKSLLAVFSRIMPLALSSVRTGFRSDEMTISSSDGSIVDTHSPNNSYLQTALQLCDFVAVKRPDEPVVDEYKGATLRKLKQPRLAYQSYHQAMLKSKQRYLNHCDASGNDQKYDDVCLAYLENFIKSSILVSAAGREAGSIDPEAQMSYLLDAEKHAAPFCQNTDQALSIRDESTFLEAAKATMLDLYNNMGIVEKKRGAFPQARRFFRKALELKANDGHALVQLASIEAGGGDDDIVVNVKELDPAYVSALFDGYSSRFESELVDVLQYKGHSLLYDALQATWGKSSTPASSFKSIVDLGCGTGLLGELVANDMPWVKVHGVDLSQRMIDISRTRKTKIGGNVYASVTNKDAAKYLSKLENQAVDCVLASDVFIYIGDISSILKESSRCLAQNGLVGFTVESYESSSIGSDCTGLKLLPSGRFGHSKRYIENMAASNGFHVSCWNNCILRKQGGKDVKGATVILRKAHDNSSGV